MDWKQPSAINDTLELAPGFASGGNRSCHVHPFDPGLCVKVALPGRTPECKRARAFWLKRLRPLRSFDENLKEEQALALIGRLTSPRERHRFPAWHGHVSTNLGPGGVTTLYRDADGSISRTLEWHIWEEGLSERVERVLCEFERFWMRETPPSRALLLHNILLVQAAGQDDFLALVDGFGYASFFQPGRLLRWLAGKKARRQVRALRKRIAILMAFRDRGEGAEKEVRFLRKRLGPGPKPL
ncbi:MAG: PhoP regulatory network protein YrbL [Opitutaceae bacterium]|jgi:hypothetical protein|nr:PhoP regulatory network protein YrbL [Opitutaceae bacterium]